MKKIFLIIAALMLLTNSSVFAGNIITYTATSQLTETTYSFSSGLHTNAFNVSITSHTFSNGTGTITFSGEVTSIGDYAFYNCTGLTSITIPSSVTSIGGSAFGACSSLTSITIPSSVTSIGSWAFSRCSSLTSITIPNSVTSIGDNAFERCSGLTSITIPESVTSIEVYAFKGCSSLTSVTIPNSVTSIGGFAFYGCSSLTSITIPESVTSIGGSAFYGCSSLTSITCEATTPPICLFYCFYNVNKSIPLYVPAESVSAYKAADQWKDFTNIQAIPGTEVRNDIITYTASEKLPETTSSRSSGLHTNAFDVSIISHTFSNGTGTITFSDEVTSIGNYAFYYCSSLTSITIPESVTSLGYNAFYNCSSLTSITVPSSVTSIGSSVFSGCSGLVSIEVASGNTNYDSRDNCNAIIETVSNTLIAGCQNTIIPNSVTSIGDYAFDDCYGLTSVIIPESVTSIGDDAFYGCSGLTSITCEATTPPTCGVKCFANVSESIPVYVPGSSITQYSQATEWSDFTNIQAIPGTEVHNDVITYTATSKLPETTNYFSSGLHTNAFNVSITSHTFADGTGTITFAGDVTSIGDYAFEGCIGLTSITIPESVTSIGYEAFYRCSALTSISMSNSVTSIGNSAFRGCISLTSIDMPESLTNIEELAFAECKSLSSLTIPNSVTYIGFEAFSFCFALTSITCEATNPPTCGLYCFYDVDKSIPLYVPAESIAAYQVAAEWKDFTNIQAIPGEVHNDIITYTATSKLPETTNFGDAGLHTNAFNVSITSHTFADGIGTITFDGDVTSIGDEAFVACSILTSITIPNSVTNIGWYAFAGCSGLTSITIPDSVTSIGECAFYNCASLSSITIPEALTDLGYEAFIGCTSLTSATWNAKNCLRVGNFTDAPFYTIKKQFTNFTFGENVERIPEHLCLGMNITSLFIPKSVKDIGSLTFSYCSSLVSIEVAADNTYFDSRNNCNAIIETASNTLVAGCKNTIIPNSVTNISEAFEGCIGLTSITIPESVTSIGYEAFYGCIGLTSITIPESVTSIGYEAFYRCSGLTSITCEASLPPTCSSSFSGVNKSIPLYVPGGSIAAYRTANEWKDFTNIQAIPGTEVDPTLSLTINTSELEAECVVASAGYSSASGYTFMLYSDSNRKTEVCAIGFDSNGQMASVSIAHAPRRAALEDGVLSFQFTVSGLSSNQTYYYIFTVDGSAGALETLTGSFKTGLRTEKAPARKMYREGRVTIETDDANYDIFGNKIQ